MTPAQSVAHKVQERHTRKLAYIYIRQSSPKQERENTGSTAVQVDMYNYAVAYGFPHENIKTVVRDQARSATTTDRRDGFKEMLADIAVGNVGAVFCSHSSRLARSSVDSHQLVQLCAITGALIIDKHGFYDPQNDNDRLFLGLKGVIDEAEGFRIRTMLMDAKLAKARQGKFRIPLPVGLIWTSSGDSARIELEPDVRVQQAFRDAFTLFERLGSSLAVVRHFNDNKILFPTYKNNARHNDSNGYEWIPLHQRRLLSILHNPIYAGDYVYGKSASRKEVILNETTRVKRRRVKLESKDWAIYIPEYFVGYISHDQYLKNQERLKNNRYRFEHSSGAPRSGPALLQGIVLCMKCGRRMKVWYPGVKEEKGFRYVCEGTHTSLGTKKCQSTVGEAIDKAATQQLLQVLNPSQLELSLEIAKQLEERKRDVSEQWGLIISQAEFETKEAEDRYIICNFRNRLVAEELERRWEEKKSELNRFRHEYAEWLKSAPRILTGSDQEAILALAQDIPNLWYSEKMTTVIRKRLLRCFIKDVSLDKIESTVHLSIHWHTGVVTKSSVSVRQPADYTRNDPAIITLIRELSLKCTDREIADHLNQKGFKTRYGHTLDQEVVWHMRKNYKIPGLFPERHRGSSGPRPGDGRYSTTDAAELLKVNKGRMVSWCQAGRVDAIRYTPRGTWWVKLTPEKISELKAEGVSEGTIQPRTITHTEVHYE